MVAQKKEIEEVSRVESDVLAVGGFDVSKIRELIPHRYPFLFVDRVLKLVQGESILACKNLSVNEEFFQGHFPERPVMPGVLILEALAQAAGILAKSSPGFEPAEGNEYFLVGAREIKWRRQVIPGDTLMLEVRLLKKKRQLLVVQGTATVDGEVAAFATINAAEVKV